MSRMRRMRGFTLIELMMTIAVAGLLIMLAGPSFQDMIVMQRLRSVSAQLHTDLQYARSEAVSRGRYVRLNFGSDENQSCYVIYVLEFTGGVQCNCLNTPACPADDLTKTPPSHFIEIKTVSIPKSGQVMLQWPEDQDSAFAFDFVTGGLMTSPTDISVRPLSGIQIDARVDDDRRLRSMVIQTGRPRVCAPSPDRMQVQAC